MAFLADHADEIEVAWRAWVVDMDGDPVPLAQLVDRARTTGEVTD